MPRLGVPAVLDVAERIGHRLAGRPAGMDADVIPRTRLPADADAAGRGAVCLAHLADELAGRRAVARLVAALHRARAVCGWDRRLAAASCAHREGFPCKLGSMPGRDFRHGTMSVEGAAGKNDLAHDESPSYPRILGQFRIYLALTGMRLRAVDRRL